MADDPKTSAEIEGARSIAVLLPQLDNGVFNASVSDALRDLIAKMRDDALARDRSSKGEIKIALKLVLEDGVFHVRADYAVRAPKEAFGKTVMWANDGNNLVPENPKQGKLPLGAVRKVDDAPVPVRKI